jgi:fatty acid CoA ligase FadD9
LSALYDEIVRRQLVGSPQRRDADSPLQERLLSTVGAVLGRADLALSGLEQSFVSLGGDSLSATRLVEALRSMAGLEISARDLLDGTKTLAQIVFRPLAASGGESVPTFAGIHGADARWARARDLRLGELLGDRLVARASALALAPEARNYLLTGVTGFVGQAVLAELLRQVDRAASVTCIVRARSDAEAFERLEQKIGAVSRGLVARLFEWRSEKRLRVLAGDVTAPTLGLDSAIYHELSETVDTVWHGGALVNHLLSYADLFPPNVLGTAHVIRFAIERRRKRLQFVSSSAVAAGVRAVIPESARAEKMWSRRPLHTSQNRGYAAGYAASKWAAEVLLADLHGRCNVPVSVVRCSMILPHREYPGLVNRKDAFARLVYGIVKTGVAPHSFYAEGYRGRRHYDAVSVDLAARTMVEICRSTADDFRIYHVSNSNWDDDVSLDTIVDWIESAGHRLQRLDYRSWYPEFIRRLAALPAEDRRRSAEPIVFRWCDPGEGRDAVLETHNFQAALARLGLEKIPSLDEGYIHHCVRGICGDVG